MLKRNATFMERYGAHAASLLITSLGMAFTVGVVHQKLSDTTFSLGTDLKTVAQRVDSLENVGTHFSRMLEVRVASQEKDIVTLKAEQRDAVREVTDIKVQLSAINTKLDAIQKTLESVAKKSQ